MKRSIWIDLLKLAAIFAIGWFALSFLLKFISPPDDLLTLSVEKEEKLGEILVEDIFLKNHQVKIVQNPRLDSAMNVITKRLTEKIGATDYEYKIRVIEGEEVNAFTMPGGNIFIYSGLIEFSEHPEEVAAVLAHEIGHSEKRHVIKKLIKELGISVLFSVLTGGDAVILDEIARTASSTIFDRAQEKEADDYSFALMEKAKINPVSLATFFRRINDKLGSYNEKMEFLMTHPNNNSRIKSALEYKTAADFKSETFDVNWELVKVSLHSISQ